MRVARSTGVVSGVLIAILGIWGALVPFVGPYFNYSFSSAAAWHYTTDRLWLCILPGVLAVVAGVLLISARTRTTGALGGWSAVLAGTWFVIGPAVSLTWEHGAGPIGRPLYGSTRQMFEFVGYFYGLGALIAILGAFSIGRLAPRPRNAEDTAAARAARAEAPTQAAPQRPAAHQPVSAFVGGEHGTQIRP